MSSRAKSTNAAKRAEEPGGSSSTTSTATTSSTTPSLSDAAYDALYDELQAIEEEHPELVTPTHRRSASEPRRRKGSARSSTCLRWGHSRR